MNETTQILYSKLPSQAQMYFKSAIKQVSQGFEGELRLICHAGNIIKMKKVITE